MQFSPAWIAAYDQQFAGARTPLDDLVHALQASTEKAGELQAVATMANMLCEQSQEQLMVLLITAVRRLADGSTDPEQITGGQ